MNQFNQSTELEIEYLAKEIERLDASHIGYITDENEQEVEKLNIDTLEELHIEFGD